jgi:archaeal flagellin FlaB
MEKRYMERLVGKYCKIVTKEPGEDRASVVTGVLEDVDYKDGFIMVDSSQGLGCLRMDTVIAIKPGTRPSERKKFEKDTGAEIGIGTLIVFIALVLVAAIAASVIMQTAETLQQRAYAVGKQTIRDVSTGIRVIGMTGFTDASRTQIQYLAIAITPRAGSFDLDMNKTLLYFQLDNFSVLRLNPVAKVDTVLPGGVFSSLDFSMLNATNYGLIVLQDLDHSIMSTNGMSVSDQALVIVNLSAALSATHGLNAGETLDGKIVPEVGVSGVFEVTAPTAFKYRVVDL